MADPVTASAMLMAGGSLFSGITGYAQGEAQQDAYEEQAIAAEEAAAQKARNIQRQSRRITAAQRARLPLQAQKSVAPLLTFSLILQRRRERTQ